MILSFPPFKHNISSQSSDKDIDLPRIYYQSITIYFASCWTLNNALPIYLPNSKNAALKYSDYFEWKFGITREALEKWRISSSLSENTP